MINPAFSSGIASVLQRYVGMKRAQVRIDASEKLGEDLAVAAKPSQVDSVAKQG